MLELLGAIVALTAALVVSYFVGKKKKRDFLARIVAQPTDVARLYLRHAPEIDDYWLHVELKTGKKSRIAAPWEVEDTLQRLALLGLQLTTQDQATLDTHINNKTRNQSGASGAKTCGHRNTGNLTAAA